ncbi:PEP-CTERM sorting domain-containing protein [uncultured Lamprocystis sp.]|uniref:PEP-CTERM sorting domain-containing protein n=1 Tax=uncultured Lamprocystis sp. TaxID=543132 RepID=UPI0025FDEE3E|nr:PEP-CTERM sorting domain-containing protein [uncultured Lamprocystis sp.]
MSVAALWLGLGAGPAAAVLLDTFTWGSDNAAYNLFAETCPNVDGSGCGQKGPEPGWGYSTTVTRSGPVPPLTGTLFSWGTGADETFNSTLTWTNDGTPFVLEKIVLKATGLVGTGLDDWSTGDPIPTSQGTGAAPAWEWATAAFSTALSEAMVEISVGGDADAYNVFSGYAEDATWFNTSDGDTRQTPVDFTASYGPLVELATNESINIRLFESYWNARGATGEEGRPDLQYASFTVEIWGSEGPVVPVPGTLALLGIGLAALGLRQRRSL